MKEWFQTFLESHAVAAVAAACGFMGSVVLLWAVWRTIGLRRAILRTGQIKSLDPNIMSGVAVLLGKFHKEQISELNKEHYLYLIGAALLALGFVLQFLHELY